jgi:hypothetical protein
MKFIEISNRACVNVARIEWVEKTDEGLSCTVCVGGKEYPSDIPYNSFLDMIKINEHTHDNFHFAG